jgi:transcriptional regulator with XRE-family HTH domain
MHEKSMKGGDSMILTNELKGKMVAKGYTQDDLAKALGITSKTLSIKLKQKKFGSDEMDKLIVILGIENPADIFFAK